MSFVDPGNSGGGFGGFHLSNSFFGGIGNAFNSWSQGQAMSQNDMMMSEAASLRAVGDRTEAKNYTMAAALAGQNEEFAVQSTAVQEAQAQRQIYQSLGQTESQVAGAGFAKGGSALDILRSSQQQGSLNKQIIGQQGLITEAGYTEQQQAYTNLSQYATYAAGVEDQMASQYQQMAGQASKNGMFGAMLSGAGALLSLF